MNDSQLYKVCLKSNENNFYVYKTNNVTADSYHPPLDVLTS